MRRTAVTGLVAIAAALGTWAAIPAAGAATASATAHATAAHATTATHTATASPAAAPARGYLPGTRPGAFPASRHIAYPAGVTPAVTAPFNYLGDVSCFHAGDCLAVGSNVTANGGYGSPIAFAWNGHGWTATAVHLPTGATAGFLTAVSCKPGGCVAVGGYFKGSTTSKPLAEFWNGRSWVNTPQPPTPSGAKYAVLAWVDCYAFTDCVAVGQYTPATNTNEAIAVAEVWNGRSWRQSLPPNPSPFHYSSFGSVSCPAATFCLVNGQYASSVRAPNGGGYFTAWTEHFDGAHWGLVSDASPTPFQGSASYLNSVSCTSSTACVAVGEADNISSATVVWHAYAEVLSGSSWRLTTVPLAAGPQSFLDTVSCASPLFCVAVGGVGPYNTGGTAGKAIAATWNGATWSVHNFTAPAGQGNILSGDTCLTASYCIAAGDQGSYSQRSGHGLTAFYIGTSWSLVSTA